MRTMTIAGSMLGLSLLLAACSGAGATTTPASAAPVATAVPVGSDARSPAVSAAAASGPASLALADNALGKILVDGKGLTLYLFQARGGPACTGECATAWHPLLTDGSAPTLGAGIDAGDVGSIARDDGNKQVTFHGVPVFYFAGNGYTAGDVAAGDTKGQGLNGQWYVIGANGHEIE
jgi:predicted lipoprotein with Yx(FWY)xxD motif